VQLADFAALSPLILLSGSAAALMLLIAIARHHRVTAGFTLVGIAAAFVCLWFSQSAAPRQVTQLFVVDDYTRFFTGVLLAATAAVVLLGFRYLDRQTEHKEEFYVLLLLATSGAVVLVASRHFSSLFLGLEILSVSLYALVAYLRVGSHPLEAGVKYLVLAATSAAFLLFGMALVYGETGFLDLPSIAAFLRNPPAVGRTGVLLAGVVMIMTGVGFKLAVVPFHLWTPDVYEGAPLPVTAFVASVSKASVFALLLRWFHSPDNSLLSGIAWTMLATMAVASMLIGNLLALQQTNAKRLLAYSSIAHMGYLVTAFLAAGALGAQAAMYYLIAYLVTILGAFGVLTVLSTAETEHCDIEDYRGLFWKRPVLAGTFAAMLLSLAGIPLTAGFLGKFYALTAAISNQLWIPVFVLVISSTIGVYYYLRVLVALFSRPLDETAEEPKHVPLEAGIALSVLMALLFVLGVTPSVIWDAVRAASASIG
jgi:NADH-quinone oxidoreductase subunit N